MNLEKARNAGISLYPTEIQALRALAQIHDGGSIPQMIRRVFGHGISEPVPRMDSDILERFAEFLVPVESRGLRAHVAKLDQPAFLARLLREVIESLKAGIPAEHLHVAGAQEISSAPLPWNSLRHAPRPARAPWRDPGTLYPISQDKPEPQTAES